MLTVQPNQVGFGTSMYKGFEKNHLDGIEIIHLKVVLNFRYIGTMKLFIAEGGLEFIAN